ncbi:2-oxoglutarate and Fe(II)-dependent oxygenase superfamily protein [Quillaja saponaria]|uniref:2-oxoglutarate and Fe(II)-dependent oxygenase superfamily protein n=1 Tax=Quillaja saponaria TaxID=32244 RepID=A0AAD7PG11_QUISA|nr:2-oxoglutarate and Fe(II)-dependent oxygenase superfamily protein [Quillaja saponaria]
MWSEVFSHPWHPTEDFTHLLPENPPEYRDVFSEYAREIGTLMNRLLSLISQGLGLDEDCLLKRLDGVTGLQVIKDGKWVPVDPVPGAFVINLGDQIQVMSNGRYKSVHHRAVTNKWLPRVSVAMFYAPNDETVIGPIEDLIDEEHPPIYRSYKFKEFMEEFYRQEGNRRRVKEAFEM